jgi:hypothetical protein
MREQQPSLLYDRDLDATSRALGDHRLAASAPDALVTIQADYA